MTIHVRRGDSPSSARRRTAVLSTAVAAGDVELEPGTYTFYCSVARPA